MINTFYFVSVLRHGHFDNCSKTMFSGFLVDFFFCSLLKRVYTNNVTGPVEESQGVCNPSHDGKIWGAFNRRHLLFHKLFSLVNSRDGLIVIKKIVVKKRS